MDSDFFEAVERYVTPAMAAHGYVVCSSGEGRSSAPGGSTLTRVPSWRAHRLVRRMPPLGRRRLVRYLTVGYECDSGDGFWVSYFPERRRLDLTSWHAVLRQHPGFDVGGSEPVDRDELRRRLMLLGDAVRAAATLDDNLEGGRPG
jgi:hypothetical protein